MPRRVGVVLVAAGLLLSCRRGPPPGYATHKKVARDLNKAEGLVGEDRLDEAAAVLEKAEEGLSKVDRLTRKRGPIWPRAKKSRRKLDGLKQAVALARETAAKRAEEEKRAAEEAASYVTKPEEKPELKVEEKRETYVDRDLSAAARFAAKERAEEKPPPEEKPEPTEDRPAIPKDLKPREPVTVVKVQVKGNYLLCYVVFSNPDTAAYLASLSVDFLDKAGKKVTYNRATFRADGFDPNWSNVYESKGVGVAANELVVGEKRQVGLVGVGDDPRARDVKRVKVAVMTTDGREYKGLGSK